MFPAKYWVEKLKMQSHPEGGFFAETYRSTELIDKNSLPKRFSGDRNFSTGIYFLLESHHFSAFHRIQSDEMWHFYAGDALNVYYIDNEEMRMLLYKRWIGLRKIKPNLKKIKKAVKEKQTPIRLVYGQHDRIILPVVGERFRKGIEDNCTITIIAAGHQVLHEKHEEKIVPLILD